MPTVSVIIPVYNAERYLERTFCFLKEQTWTDYEVIFVDDCSKDESLTFLKEFEMRDKRFRFIRHRENKGCGEARNTGIREAQGEYAICLDVDDLFEPDLLKEMLDSILISHADVAICNSIVKNMSTGETRHFGQWNRLMSMMDENIMVVNKPIAYPNICNLIDYVAWNKMFRLSYFKEKSLWFPNLKYYEDIPFAFLSCFFAEKIVFVKKELIHYGIQNKDSMTSWTIPKEFYMIDAFYYVWRRRKEYQWDIIKESFVERAIRNITAVYHSANSVDKEKIFKRMTKRLLIEWSVSEIVEENIVKRFLTDEKEQDEEHPIILYGDKIGLCANSNPYTTEKIEELNELKRRVKKLGLDYSDTPSLSVKSIQFGNDGIFNRAKWIMDFYKDSDITYIFDVSGGDLANEILPYLDYETIKQSKKVFVGYSDLTCIINAIYTKTGQSSLLYRICNLYKDYSGEQMKRFKDTLLEGGKMLTDFHYTFYRGKEMHGIVLGGNIRCFLKLAGTEYWPILKGKILFLESLDDDVTAIRAYLAQLKQLDVFSQIIGVIIGTFGMEDNVLEIDKIILEQVPEHIPVVKTREVGHGYLSKAIWIGRELQLIREDTGCM